MASLVCLSCQGKIIIIRKKKGLLPSLTQLIHNFKKSQKKREKRKKEKIKTPENEPVLPIFNRLFSFTSESGIHVFQSILSKQLRLNFIPFISVLLLSLFFFCRSQGQSRRKVESLCFFLSSRHMHPPGTYISAKSKVAAHCGRCGGCA